MAFAEYIDQEESTPQAPLTEREGLSPEPLPPPAQPTPNELQDPFLGKPDLIVGWFEKLHVQQASAGLAIIYTSGTSEQIAEVQEQIHIVAEAIKEMNLPVADSEEVSETSISGSTVSLGELLSPLINIIPQETLEDLYVIFSVSKGNGPGSGEGYRKRYGVLACILKAVRSTPDSEQRSGFLDDYGGFHNRPVLGPGEPKHAEQIPNDTTSPVSAASAA